MSGLKVVLAGAFAGALLYLSNVLSRGYSYEPIEQEMLTQPVNPYDYVPSSWQGVGQRTDLAFNDKQPRVSYDNPLDQQQQMVKHIGYDYRQGPPALIGMDGVWIDKNTWHGDPPMINEPV